MVHQRGASPPRSTRAGTRATAELLPDLRGVVVLPLLLGGVVGLPVDRLEGLDLIEIREIAEVVGSEPVRNLADVVGSEEALAQLAPGTVVDRPRVGELDLLAEAPIDEHLGEHGMRSALGN